MDAKGLSGRVVLHNGRFVFEVGGERIAPLSYHLTGGAAHDTWREEVRRHVGQFAEAGYRVISPWFPTSDYWLPDGSVSVESVCNQIRGILDVHPHAAIMLRNHLFAPGWWLDAHPGETVGYALPSAPEIPAHLRAEPGRCESFVSEVWRREATDALARFLRALAETPEGDAVFAIHLAGGHWSEWFYHFFEFEPDTGPAMTRHFRDWLRAKYGSEERLRASWREPDLTFDTVEVPGWEPRLRSTERHFRDPVLERPVIDYYQCHHEAVADTPLLFCRATREAWPRPIAIGLFHAYLLHLHHQASGGHLEMQRVLESPDVDFFSSPFSYEFDARFMGGSAHVRCMTESVRLHRKLYMNEMDHPTHVGDNFKRPQPFSSETVVDAVTVFRRNMVHSLALGQGTWCLDFGPPDLNGLGGWWADPALMAEAGRVRRLTEILLDRPWSSAADVLLVYDPRAFYYTGQMYLGLYHQTRNWLRSETFSFEALNRTVSEAYRSGCAFDTVLLDDLPRVDLSRFRAVVYAYTPYMTEAHREFAKRRVAADGRTVVWVYAPGYTDGETNSDARIADTTGMGVCRATIGLPCQLLIRKNALAPGFPETRINTDIRDAWPGPTFRVEDPDAETLGYYGGSRQVALARKCLAGHTAWYCAMPLRGPSVMREIFRSAGCHVCNEADDVIYEGGGILCIHTETGGERRIALRNGSGLTVELPPWSTTVLDSETGRVLLGP
jgi:hypothetical protein